MKKTFKEFIEIYIDGRVREIYSFEERVFINFDEEFNLLEVTEKQRLDEAKFYFTVDFYCSIIENNIDFYFIVYLFYKQFCEDSIVIVSFGRIYDVIKIDDLTISIEYTKSKRLKKCLYIINGSDGLNRIKTDNILEAIEYIEVNKR